MLEMLDIALNNNIIYICVISALLIIIFLTILSIKKDRDKMVKKNKNKIREVETIIDMPTSKEEQEQAKLELEKVVNSMKNDLENKKEPTEIMTYEQEQEDKAIISYQELVEAVRRNKESHKPQTEIGMEVASEEVIEEPKSVSETLHEEELNHKVDNIMDMINTVSKEKDDNNDNSTLLEELPIKEEVTEKKFQTSEFISPIYGRQPQIQMKKEEVKEVSSLDEVINEDLSNSSEFLDALKNFRSNLK